MSPAHAILFEGCGDYVLRGVLMPFTDDQFKVRYTVLQNTQSQHYFYFKDQKYFQIMAPHLNQFTKIVVSIRKKLNGNAGEISSVQRVERAFPNPLRLEGDFIRLSSYECID